MWRFDNGQSHLSAWASILDAHQSALPLPLAVPHAGCASGDDDRFFLFFLGLCTRPMFAIQADGSRLHSARLPMHLYLTVTVNNK